LISSSRNIIFAGGGLPNAIREAAADLRTAINQRRTDRPRSARSA
jgi:hypothetical protein